MNNVHRTSVNILHLSIDRNHEAAFHKCLKATSHRPYKTFLKKMSVVTLCTGRSVQIIIKPVAKLALKHPPITHLIQEDMRSRWLESCMFSQKKKSKKHSLSERRGECRKAAFYFIKKKQKKNAFAACSECIKCFFLDKKLPWSWLQQQHIMKVYGIYRIHTKEAHQPMFYLCGKKHHKVTKSHVISFFY